MKFLYLHGFASSEASRKGIHLAAAFERAGVHLERLELNVPSFARLSPLRALDVVAEAAGDDPVTLIGSSLGGWMSAIFAERRPEQVDRVVLLCPGFGLAERWPALIGADGFARWQRRGVFVFEDAIGRPTGVHWGFVEEARTLPPWPRVRCPALVLHGMRDETVPFAFSERWVAAQPDARLVPLDDDHALVASLDRIAAETLAFLGIE